jgi:hypothetical protein
MAELCREFGISRKTGYKIFESEHPRMTLAMKHSVAVPKPTTRHGSSGFRIDHISSPNTE